MGPFQSLCLNNVVSNLSEDELQEVLRNRRIELEQRRLSTNYLTTSHHHFKNAASKIEVISAYSSQVPCPDEEGYSPDEGFEGETFRRTYKVARPDKRDSLRICAWRVKSRAGRGQDSEIWMCYQESNSGLAEASCDRRVTYHDFRMKKFL